MNYNTTHASRKRLTPQKLALALMIGVALTFMIILPLVPRNKDVVDVTAPLPDQLRQGTKAPVTLKVPVETAKGPIENQQGERIRKQVEEEEEDDDDDDDDDDTNVKKKATKAKNAKHITTKKPINNDNDNDDNDDDDDIIDKAVVDEINRKNTIKKKQQEENEDKTFDQEQQKMVELLKKRQDGATYEAIYPTEKPSPRGMVYYPKSYQNFGVCPSDTDISSYINIFEPQNGGLTIFHFGTGGHHIVGLTNHQRVNPNFVIGITASPAEYQSYIELCLKDGSLGKDYVVYFGDIYNLQPQFLPPLDIASMPHIGEYYDPTKGREANITVKGANVDRSKYAALDDKSLLDLIVDKLVPGGRLLIYTRSHGASLTTDLLQNLIYEKKVLRYKQMHGSIAVYTKIGELKKNDGVADDDDVPEENN